MYRPCPTSQLDRGFRHDPDARPRRALPKGPAVVALCLLALAAGSAAADPPTVNGRFYGDGDAAKYVEYATSYLGSKLYVYYDAPTATIYTALVVNTSVNDNVFGQPDGRKDYMSSVGWGNGGGQQRGADKLTDSEFAQFTFACAPGSPNSWTWSQGYACQSGAQWVADMSCSTSAGAPPPGYQSASSFAWNMNTYASNGGALWDREVVGTRLRDWVSPFDPDQSPMLALGLDGYPSLAGAGFSPVYQYEWRMVYEWSVPLGPNGAGCGGNLLYVVTGLSHHSPLKEELGVPPPECGDPENDCFPGDLTTADPLSDYGDLPDGYGTSVAADGARHSLSVSGPYLGQEIIPELDGQPTIDGTGDGAEEDGVTAVVDSFWTAGSTQTIDVVVSNAPAGALLGGWFDWNGDGDFGDQYEFFSWSVSQGTNPLTVTVGAGFDWATDILHARFRLFSGPAAAPGGSLDVGDSVGAATDGEVEDYVWSAGTLPVTLNAFSSAGRAGGPITVRWQTASETDNVGFEVWGRIAGGWRPISELVPSRDMNSRLPKNYELTLHAPPQLTALQLVGYNSRGATERSGPYRLGARYGEVQPARRIDWTAVRAERDRRLQARGFEPVAGGSEDDRDAVWKHVAIGVGDGSARSAGSSSTKGTAGVAGARQTHVAVTEAGVQRVTYEALRDGGLDLAGQPARDIAVTRRGAPVARWIDGPRLFGPGSAIEFVALPPRGDDALYVGADNVQISLDPKLARDARTVPAAAVPRVSHDYETRTTSDRPLRYHSQSPTGDPWIEALALARTGIPATVELELELDDPVLDGKQRVVVDLGTLTDLPDLTAPGGGVLPEHNVEVWVTGPSTGPVRVVAESTSGQRLWRIEAELPDGLIGTGANRIELRFTTGYLFSGVVVDRYGLVYRTPYRGPELDFAPDPGVHGYEIAGFDRPTVAAYSVAPDGALTRHQAVVFPSVDGYVATIRQHRPEDARGLRSPVGTRFWVTDAPHSPAVFTTEAPADLFATPADLVVVAGSSFVGTPALETYLADRADLDPVVVDVEDIYNTVGYGMALPSAITDYLRARAEVQPYTHVQLIGADCWDRRNFVSQCVSFVPLPTAEVGLTRFSPSHNRLVDLDGDGVGDVAVAQLSVRTGDELATIVGKGAAWHTSGLAAGGSALLVAEEGDGKHDFLAQVGRIADRLDAPLVDLIDMAAHSDIATARDELRSALDAGRSLTVFSGHSSPVMWAYRGLLTATSAADLTNFGLPTLMIPLACETSYDISPSADVLGHQLLYAGDQGAVAISGAVSLSSLDDNELMANHILAGLESGLTLGEAVQAAREALGARYRVLQDNWMTQGDVALRMER